MKKSIVTTYKSNSTTVLLSKFFTKGHRCEVEKFFLPVDRHHLIIKAIMLMTMTCIFNVHPGGFKLYEQGNPNIGAAAAGQAAIAADASTVYFNPAGMTYLDRAELLMGGQGMLLETKFRSNSCNNFLGCDGGDAGNLFPGGGLYISKRVHDNVWLGLSMNAPAAIGLDYEKEWKGRYLVQNNFFLVLDIDPAIAIKLTDWLSIGAGIDINYGYLYQELALFNLTLGDGKIEEAFTDWAVGGNIGVMIKPYKNTRIGITYRSESDLKLSGDIDISGQGVLWTLQGLQSTFGKTSIKLPHAINVSGYREFAKKFAVLCDVGWENWSSMDKTVIDTSSGKTITLQRRWKDTWRAGLGFTYRPGKCWLVRTGISYDSTPIRGKCGLPDLPVDDQSRYAVGFDYDLEKNSKLSVSYIFINFGDAKIDRTIEGTTKRFAGDYNQKVHLVSISFSHRFGA